MLTSTKSELHALIVSSPEAMLIIDGKGQIVDANKPAAKLFSYRPKDLSGEDLNTLMPERFRKKHARYLKQFFSSPAVRPMSSGLELFGCRKDGTEFPVEISLHPFQTDEGTLTYAAIRDLTGYKQTELALRESEIRLKTIVDNMPAAVFLRDADGRFILINKTYEEMYGVSNSAVRGKTLFDVFPKAQSRRYSEHDAKVILEKGVVTEEISARLDRGEIALSSSKFPVLDDKGELAGVAGIEYDVTEHKRAISDLEKAEHDLRERTNFFRLLGRIAEHANTATTIEEAIQSFLTDVCMFTGWPLGHAYVRSTEGPDRLLPTGIWHLADADRFAKFREVTEKTEFKPGVGLPGRVMASGKSEWIKDVTKGKNTPRAKQAADTGVRAGFAIPVIVESEVAAVLEFFATTPIEPDESQLMTFMQTGAQLSRVVERTRAEEALRESQKALEQNRGLLSTILDNIPAQIFLRDLDGKYQFINKTYSDVFGISRDNAIGKGIHEVLPAEFVETHRKVDSEVIEKRRVVEHDVVLKDDSDERIFSTIKFPVFDADGNINSVGGFALDVTDHRRAEEAQRDSEEQLRLALDNMPGGMRLVDRDLKNVLFNSHYLEMCGYPDELLVVGGSMYDELRYQAERGDFGPGDPEELIEQVFGRYRRGESFSSERTIPGGPTLQIDIGPTPEGGFVSVLTDITARRQAEEAVSKNEQMLESILDSSPIGATIVNADGTFEFVNSRMARMVGLSKQEFLSKYARDLYVNPAERDQIAKRLAKEGRLRDIEMQMKKADGTAFWILLSFEPMRSKDHRQYFGWVYDISERKEVELELQESRDTFQSLADNLPEFISMKDLEGRFMFVNKVFEEWVCVDRNDVIGKTADDIYPEEQAIEFNAIDRKAIERRQVFSEEVNLDYPDGSTRGIIRLRFPVFSSDGEMLGLGTINHDITARKREEEELRQAKDQAEMALSELKRTQEQLVRSQKMASLGQLTAGIAHEIKNPLNFVNNFAETSVELVEELEKEVAAIKENLDDEARENIEDLFGTLTGDLQKINQHGRRADGIVKSMLLHARGDDSILVETDLNPLVSEALHLAYHGERAKDKSFQVTLDEQLHEAAGAAEIVPQEITRVLVNLFGNAFYAVKKRTQQAADNTYEPKVRVTTTDRGNGVEILVWDNGTGIPEEARSKLFDPFFTTKPPGEGTGLGLSMCYDIVVQQHGGEMSIDSVADEFTEFRILLPHKSAQTT